MKAFAKWFLRRLLYARLAWLPLSERSALYWVEVMKRWPALFAEHPYVRRIVLDDGLQLEVGLVDVVERHLLLEGRWDVQVLDVLRRELRPGDTFVDVGANIGYFTLVASKLVGTGGKVLALEPSHVNLARLSRHSWLNRAGNVLIASVAAGRGNAIAALNFPTFNNAGAATLRPCSSVQQNQVLQMPLDDLLEAHQLQPNLVKLDIEGFELEALRGFSRTLARFGPVVVCELTDSFLREIGQDARELLAFMEGLGYSCSILPADGSGQGAVLVSNGAYMPDGQVDVVFRRVASS